MSSVASNKLTPASSLPTDDALDRIFSALGDRTRRAILRRLEQGPARAGELAEPFAISLPAISRHLRVLEEAGLIARRVDGRVHTCRLEPERLREVDVWLNVYRRFWNHSLDALAAFVEDETDA